MTAAVKEHPGSPEAHYFLGYTIDRINANDGAGMHRMTKAQTVLDSEQFELVSRLEKKYTGEMLALDTYSKKCQVIKNHYPFKLVDYLYKNQ